MSAPYWNGLRDLLIMETIYIPIADNGMGLSRTSWAICMFGLGLTFANSKNYEVIAEGFSYPYPDGTMNLCTDSFLKSKAERMLVIDTDIIFRPMDVAILLADDLPFVAGMYPKKTTPLEFPIELLDGQENPFADTQAGIDLQPLVKVKRVARGFSCIHRSVFEEIATKLGDKEDIWQNLPGGSSEDFRFCDKLRTVGIDVVVDQRVRVRHEGSAVYPL